ncbi:MAG: YebC/PmpR family DNA-binding transcriptional regulator [Candidatus Aminicenantes bacterium]|nr:YebC/PmpR family DNA-binding transcriptional regulator [Candidatus Aminicenantes bacterium]
MSGHSKWHSIRHKKAVVDAKRGKLFTKLIREIIIAARMGGGDPEKNPRLRKAIEAAKDANMPKDNIERAIKKGTGELEGEKFEEVTYEGYGPGGVAVFVEATTDNRNRTASEIRRIFSKHGGNLGESGCVAWMFKRKGYIVIEKDKAPSEEELFDIAVEAGAEDVKDDESNFVILTAPEDLFEVVKSLEEKGIEIATKELGMIPDTYIKLQGKDAQQMLKLMEELEDHDDVQHVWANFDIPEEEIEKFSE